MNYLKMLAAATAFASSAGLVQAQDTVRIAHSTESFAFVPLFTAITMGTFEDVGLNAETVRTGSGAKTTAAVIGGSAEIAIVAPSDVLYVRREGVDMKMLAGLVTQYTTSIVYSKDWAAQHDLTAESSHEDMLKALEGARVATPGPGGGDHIIRYFANEAGIDPDRDMTIVYLGQDIGVYQSALQEGRIDGISMSAPTPQIAIRDQGAIYAFNTGAGEVEALDGFLYIVAAARGDWADENPETVGKVVQAFDEAVRQIRDPETSEAARDSVYAAYYPDLDKGIFDEIWSQFAAGMPEDVSIHRDDLMRVVDFTNTFEKDRPIEARDVDGALLE